MRLVHLATDLETPASGVAAKIVRTVKTWRRLGAEAHLVDGSSGEVVEPGDTGRPAAGQVTTAPISRVGWLRRTEANARRLLDTLDRLRPDIVYTREMIWTPAVEAIFRRHRVVLEINSDAAGELTRRSRAAAAYWRTTAGRLRRRAAGIVAVTGELADDLVPVGTPRIVLGNAVEVPAAPRPRLDAEDDRPMLLMLVGSPAAWHGLDRLGRLATIRPDLRIVVCGRLGDVGRTLPVEVECRPPVEGAALDAILAEATVGVGTLALGRKGLREACPLKSRATLAAGRPLVYAHDDPELDGTEVFALRIPDADDVAATHGDRIAAFARAALADPSIGRAAWGFARDRLAVDAIERRRLDFLADLRRGAVRG